MTLYQYKLTMFVLHEYENARTKKLGDTGSRRRRKDQVHILLWKEICLDKQGINSFDNQVFQVCLKCRRDRLPKV